MTNVLLPLAEEGLIKVGIDAKDIKHYLNIVERRINSRDGSRWTIDNYRKIVSKFGKDAARRALTKTMYIQQQLDNCVADWEVIDRIAEVDPPKDIAQIMTTGVISVQADDLAALAVSIMDWKEIHHLPVVDSDDHLIGLLTWQHVINTDYASAIDHSLSVADIMVKAVVSVAPYTTIVDAIQTMKYHEIGCLPVTDKGYLVGIITLKDIQQYDTEPVDA